MDWPGILIIYKCFLRTKHFAEEFETFFAYSRFHDYTVYFTLQAVLFGVLYSGFSIVVLHTGKGNQ